MHPVKRLKELGPREVLEAVGRGYSIHARPVEAVRVVTQSDLRDIRSVRGLDLL